MNSLRTHTQALGPCMYCGSLNLETTLENDAFEYGEGNDKTTLSIQVPVHHCKACGGSFSTDLAETLRHEAVCAHLGLLAPREIKELRRRHEISQADFAEISGIGRASLARWETGQLLQSASNDNLLYLLSFEDNWKRLRSRRIKNGQHQPFKPRLRAISDDEIEIIKLEAESFDIFAEQ